MAIAENWPTGTWELDRQGLEKWRGQERGLEILAALRKMIERVGREQVDPRYLQVEEWMAYSLEGADGEPGTGDEAQPVSGDGAADPLMAGAPPAGGAGVGAPAGDDDTGREGEPPHGPDADDSMGE